MRHASSVPSAHNYYLHGAMNGVPCKDVVDYVAEWTPRHGKHVYSILAYETVHEKEM